MVKGQGSSRAIMVCITVFKVAMNKIIHLGNSTFEAVKKQRNPINAQP